MVKEITKDVQELATERKGVKEKGKKEEKEDKKEDVGQDAED